MDIISYSMAKKYSNMVALGLASATVDDVNKSITFTLAADGSQHTIHFNQPSDGHDGVSVTGVSDKGNGVFTLLFSDGSESDPIQCAKGDKGDKGDKLTFNDLTDAEKESLKGSNGVSPTITENADNTDKIYKLDITTADTTFTTPNLKGADGQGGEGASKWSEISEKPFETLDETTLAVDESGKLSVIGGGSSSGEENIIESIKVNGVAQTVDADKSVDITVPEAYDDTAIREEISSKADASAIPSLEGYVTERQLEAKGYLTEHQDISELENKSHEHNNKTVIDKFSISDIGTLLFDGNEIKGGSGTAGKSAYEIAVDNGFTGTETEWLESLHGEEGRSINTVTNDTHNNVIATFTDGTTENLGQLTYNIQGDFLSSDGAGNLRYYNSHFQYYDESSSTWVDTSVTPSNVYIMNMTPQPMKKIFAVYDTDLCKYKFKFEEPDDTIIDGQVACIVEKVIIRRKLGSVPTSETDGDLVLEIKRKDFGSYKNEYFVDTALSPSDGEIFYYKAFPMSTTGFYNSNSANETEGIKCKDYNLYGFKLDQNESDPASMITYLSDCDNKYYESAKMNYATDTFNYGDWGDVWFIKNLKPCMLKYDGTVDYELYPNDYTKKLDGSDSDVANDAYEGNAMVGIPKVYWKIVDNGDNTANIYFSDKKLDDDFHCWSHIDNNGNEIDYCYMSIYNGSNVNSVLRSISGKVPIGSQTATTEITYAKANNISSDIIWYTELFNDRMLINLLLLLIGKSTDTQTVFGLGHYSGEYLLTNGTMDTKGLFYGINGNAGVKVFGIENWYGNQCRRIAGWINDNGTQKIKMTYGQSDGSTVDGYNETGSGYISITNSAPSGTSSGYISKMLINDNGLIPLAASGSATTYYCDGLWFNNSQVNYPIVGGSPSFHYQYIGAFFTLIHIASSYTFWDIGTSLSCKPLAQTI